MTTTAPTAAAKRWRCGSGGIRSCGSSSLCVRRGLLPDALADRILGRVADKVDDATEYAQRAPFPRPEDALHPVYGMIRRIRHADQDQHRGAARDHGERDAP